MKNVSKVLATATSVFSGLFLASSAYAEGFDLSNIDSAGVGDLQSFIKSLLNWGIGLAAIACVAILIVSGYLYITAAGDEGKVEKATKTVTFAIVGLVICFIAVILVQFVLGSILKTS